MLYSLWKPFHLSFDASHRVDELFNELIHEPWGYSPQAATWQPVIDVIETTESYILEADLPGVLPEHLDLQIQGNLLHVRGHRELVQISRTPRSLSIERARGDFSREFKLLHPVNAKAVKIYFEEGVLFAVLPKDHLNASSETSQIE